MRKNIITAAVLSAMLLTGCGSEIQPEQTEADVTSYSETTASTEETVSKAKSKYSEELPENMRLFNFAKLNSEDEFTAVNNPAVNRTVKIFVNGNILCVSCRITNSDGTASRNVLRLYSIDGETTEKTIDLPDNCIGFNFIGGGGDILCKGYFTEHKEDENGAYQANSVITVKNDYSYEFSELTPQTAALPRGGHNISEWYLDIIDADRDMTLMEGSHGESGYETFSDYRYHVYMFPVDDDRFVYLTGGYEYTSCFGIYDFRTDTCSDLPDTADMRPIGIRNGKIYSVLKPWDKTDSDIYVTDTETLETVKAISCPKTLKENDQMYYLMTENSGCILYMYAPGNGETSNIIGFADPDTGDIIREYDIPYGNEFYSQLYLKDENTAVIISNRMDKALIISL